jgi:hypothetical protein
MEKPVIIHQKIKNLSADLQILFEEAEREKPGSNKIMIKKPNPLFIIFFMMLGLLFITLFIIGTIVNYKHIADDLIMSIVISSQGYVYVFLGVRALIRRAMLNQYYIFLHFENLIEKTLRWISIIPISRILYVYDSKGDPQVWYKDDAGREQYYNLKDYYKTKHDYSSDIVEALRKRYGVKTPYHIYGDYVSKEILDDADEDIARDERFKKKIKSIFKRNKESR